jgi:ZIP family zinc transporter
MNFYLLLFAIVTFFSTLLGGVLAARYRNNIGILAAFAAGILIAVPLFDLLPETFKLAVNVQVSLENVMSLTALGFIFLYVLERYLSLYRAHESQESGRVGRARGGLFATSELTAHSLMDGLAIGLGFQFDLHVGIIVAVAVICHDFSDGLSAFTVMMSSGNTLRTSIRMLFLDAVAPVVGAALTLFIQV